MKSKSKAEKVIGSAIPALNAEVRRHALEHGWDKEVVKGLHLKYDNSELSAHVPSHHSDAAWTLEYGSESRRPTAALRKLGNTPHKVDEILAQAVHNHFKGML